VIDLFATVVGEERPKRPVVPLDQVEPSRVTDGLDQSR